MKTLAKRGNKAIGAGIGIMMTVVVLVLIKALLDNTTWNAGIETTIVTYVIPFGLLSVLGMTAYLGARRR